MPLNNKTDIENLKFPSYDRKNELTMKTARPHSIMAAKEDVKNVNWLVVAKILATRRCPILPTGRRCPAFPYRYRGY